MNALNSPRLLASLALCTVVLGRGASRGLPGLVSGFDGAISQLVTLGAVLTQLCGLVFMALSTRLTVLAIISQVRPVPFLVLGAITTGATTLVGLAAALSMDSRLDHRLISFVAALVLLTAGASGALALKHVERRAAAILSLGFVTTAALHLVARWVALGATASADASLYRGSQALATAAMIVELVALAGVLYWTLKDAKAVVKGVASVALVCVPALALYAGRDTGVAPMLQSTLQQLSVHPDPLLPAWILASGELWGLLAVCCTLFSVHHAAALCFVTALSTLGRSSADIPVYAVFLLVSALALQLPHFGQEPADQP